MADASRVARALAIGLFIHGTLCAAALAAAEQAVSVEASSDQQLEEVVITGSLIPTTGEMTAVPSTTITQEDLQNKGYLSIADALQRQVYSTGGLNNSQQTDYMNLYTPGAQSLSMFGLPPGYVKYLIDGRPMPDYPALYGGTDVISDIDGIPEDLIDHVDILPGGQSSLYGSDAIAGVVNVVMKKNVAEPVIRARLGGYEHGGGTARRITAAAGHEFGAVNLMGGVEYEKIDPIWGYQRDLTKERYAEGSSPQLAALDWVVSAPRDNGPNFHYLMDPANCANVASQFYGSVGRYSRPNQGDACGTVNAGYNTISNQTESTQGYLHATAELADSFQLYADTLLAHSTDRFSTGTEFVTADELPDGLIYDPNLADYVGLQHVFSPEEAGGLGNTLSSVTANTERFTLGADGKLGHSEWNYDLCYTYMEQRLVEATHHLLASQVYSYFDAILGPDLGPDPNGYGYSTRTPDYARFYTPVPVSQYMAMDTLARTDSRTEDGMLRGQLTNAALWRLPGGNAGIALAAEVGHEEWRYDPDPRYFNGELYSATAVSGGGDRSRYAITGELRVPIEPWLAITGSSRFDSYHVSGNDISSNTYNVGLELRPAPQLLLRGRIGTAFKAPTLADQFQGLSYDGVFVTDYYQCALQSQNPSTCDIGYSAGRSTSGNPNLQPIKANISSVGVVWTPASHAQLSADYLHWNIGNEMTLQSQDEITLTESKCRLGALDIHTPTCVAALQYVTRDSHGDIVNIYLPKINLANDLVNAFVAHGSYEINLGDRGTLELQAGWNDILTHTVRVYPGDPTIDLLATTDSFVGFKSRIDASVTWAVRGWHNTIYVNRVGSQPNHAATFGGPPYEPNAGSLHPWTITNLTTRYQWSRHLELSASIQNAFDVMPPTDRTWGGKSTSPYSAGAYDVNGRSYYAQLTYQLGN